jgi:hypothetical protein
MGRDAKRAGGLRCREHCAGLKAQQSQPAHDRAATMRGGAGGEERLTYISGRL